LQITASPVLALSKVINLIVLIWIFYGSIMTIMSIQLASVVKSCLVTKCRSVMQAGAN